MIDSLNHVAIIMDGNGRWAKSQNKKRTFGHYHGANNVRDIALHANNLGVKVLTLYAFSTENWKRPLEEVDYLMKLPAIFFDRFMDELMQNQIKVECIGHFHRLAPQTRKVLERAIEKSKNNTKMKLVFAMDYGSRDEIVEAMKKYAAEVSQGRENNLVEKEVEQYLMTHDYGDVDLLIRTSNEKRISNFLLWQIAYAELIFTQTPWPLFTPQEFDKCIEEYHSRDRRFGGLNK